MTSSGSSTVPTSATQALLRSEPVVRPGGSSLPGICTCWLMSIETSDRPALASTRP